MELSSWIMLGIVFWVFGYIKTKFGESSDGELLVIPKWIFMIICGYPQSIELPANTVLIAGLRAQVTGFLLIVFGLFTRYLISEGFLSVIISLISIPSSLLLSIFLVNLLSRR